MMTIAPTTALQALAAPTPQAAGAAPDAAPPGRSFAQLLEQRRGQPAPPPREAARPERQGAQSTHGGQPHASSATARPEPGRRADSADSADGTEADTAAPCGQRCAAAGRDTGKARHAGDRSASARADAKAAADRKAAAEADGKRAAATEDDSKVDPALAAWLAGLQLPDNAAAAALPAPPAAPIATSTAAMPGEAEGSAVTAANAAATESGTRLAALAASGQASGGASGAVKTAAASEVAADLARGAVARGHDPHDAAGGTPADPADTDAGTDDMARRDAGQAGGTTGEAGPVQGCAADRLAASFAPSAAATMPPSMAGIAAAEAAQAAHAAASAQAVAATAAGHDAGRPLPVALATPLTSPEFAQAIGVRIGLLARDGIEHAELQLNPAEMGPVSVRIVVDGAQARVDFGADVAATRHAIESSLPELAGALRDAGFTLTGGGVSPHAHPHRDGQAGTPGQGRGGARAEAGQPGDKAEPAARRTVRAGGVDLYA